MPPSAEESIVAAVKAKDVATVRALLQADPGLAQTRTQEGSLVLTALYHGAEEVLPLLLETDLDLNVFEASALGDAERVAELLRRSPSDANAMNTDGFTPLGLAAFFGHAEVAQRLLSEGAEVDQVMQSVNTNTPLDAAVAANRREVVELLLQSGASTESRAAGGYTPLHKAAFGGNVEMTRLLLERGADPEATTDEGRMALDIAVEREFDEVAEVLRQRTGSA